MAKTFFTSDTHFNHANVIKYCARPFASVEEMNRELLSRWNAVVGPEDTVFHLDDFSMGKTAEWPGLLRQLNGAKKILVRGNHDQSRKQMLAGGFTEVHEKLEWEGWLLQHHPVNTSRKLLCGHIHEKWRRIGSTINVGVDVCTSPLGPSRNWSRPRSLLGSIGAATAGPCSSTSTTTPGTIMGSAQGRRTPRRGRRRWMA